MKDMELRILKVTQLDYFTPYFFFFFSFLNSNLNFNGLLVEFKFGNNEV